MTRINYAINFLTALLAKSVKVYATLCWKYFFIQKSPCLQRNFDDTKRVHIIYSNYSVSLTK